MNDPDDEFCDADIAFPFEPKHRHRDLPLGFRWRASEWHWTSLLGLSPAKSAAYARARNATICELMVRSLTHPEAFISYSRTPEHYARSRRYYDTDYTCATVTASVDELESLGLIEHDRAWPGRFGLQSRFRSSPQFVDNFADALPLMAYVAAPCSIILKDTDKRLTDYPDTAQTQRMTWEMARINEAAASCSIQVPGLKYCHGLPLASYGNGVINTASLNYRRIFNNFSFRQGGRCYGHFTQSLPKAVRAQITLNGSPVVEVDHPQLHPQLIYAMAGTKLEGDAYTIDGWPRPLAKAAFNTLINAETDSSAWRSIAQEVGGAGAYNKACRLIDAIKARHRPIERYFGSGEGLRLQRIDSDMAVSVTLKMLDQGVIVLGVHDSFIAPSGYENELQGAMVDALNRTLNRLRNISPKSLSISATYDTPFRHSGGGALPCLGVRL